MKVNWIGLIGSFSTGVIFSLMFSDKMPVLTQVFCVIVLGLLWGIFCPPIRSKE